jgi:hypothetical protein
LSPETVLSVTSPDGKYEAYVEESFSVDPPNQSLFVEQSDKIHFLRIAKLGGDIDFIKQIVWSPDSKFVVFHSNDYLTATRIADWYTVRIYLAPEWRRAKPQRRLTTFTSVGARRQVEAIEFPEDGCFSYHLRGHEDAQVVNMEL